MSAYYNTAKFHMLGAGLNLVANDIRAQLVDTGVYTFSAAHVDYDVDLTGKVGSAVALSNKSVSATGVFDADDLVIPSVSGASTEAVVIFDNTNNRLLAYLDGASVEITPNGNNVNVTWDAAGILAIGGTDFTNAAKAAMFGSGLNLDSQTIMVSMTDDADYTFAVTDANYGTDIPAGAKVAAVAISAGKTIANGVFDANDVVFTSVTGDPTESLIIWNDTHATDLIICKVAATVTPNGNNINLTWGTNIFAL